MTQVPAAQPAGVGVRPAQPTDADEVARVHVRTWQSAYAGIVPASVLTTLDDQIEERAERMRQRWQAEPGRFTTMVATAGGPPVGFVTFGPYRLDGPGDQVDPTVGEVLAIYVDPDRQGGGAGRALLDTAVAALRDSGAGEVRLWVLEQNAPSRRFYERHGFVADGAWHLFRVHEPDGTPVDLPEVRYARELR